jgi:hypothetical protein
MQAELLCHFANCFAAACVRLGSHVCHYIFIFGVGAIKIILLMVNFMVNVTSGQDCNETGQLHNWSKISHCLCDLSSHCVLISHLEMNCDTVHIFTTYFFKTLTSS